MPDITYDNRTQQYIATEDDGTQRPATEEEKEEISNLLIDESRRVMNLEAGALQMTRAQVVINMEALAEASKWYPEGDTKRLAYEALHDVVKADLGKIEADEYNQAFDDWAKRTESTGDKNNA